MSQSKDYRVGDILVSESGIRVRVEDIRVGYYVVEVLDGSPFQSKEEITRNLTMERSQINSDQLEYWGRENG